MSQGMQAASKHWKRPLKNHNNKPKDFPVENKVALKMASTLARQDPFWTCDLHDCKIIHLGCFQPLSFWSLVTADTGHAFTLFLATAFPLYYYIPTILQHIALCIINS